MSRPRRHAARRGGIYLGVLAAAVIVTVIGLGALLLARVQRRRSQVLGDLAEARQYARAAVELGRQGMALNDQWRQQKPSGNWIDRLTIDDGWLRLRVIDEEDGDLGDSQYDPVVITGIGVRGQARHKMQVTLVADIRPLAALNTCLHAGGDVEVKGGKSIAVLGAALSTNGAVDNGGTIDGDVEAVSLFRAGTITGTVTVPAEAKDLPDAGVVDLYAAKATPIACGGTIEKCVLGPASNPWGIPNGDGVYVVDTGGSDLTVKLARIHGTLVVRTQGHRVKLDNTVLMHSYRADYPVLIVDGDVELKYSSVEKLSEQDNATNFNPAGSPYEGFWDDDQADEYPSEVRGLVHVLGDLKLSGSARVRGTIVCEGSAVLDGYNHIAHDASIPVDPPEGYSTVEQMKVSPGSWRRTLD
jgi:hypothetical protein